MAAMIGPSRTAGLVYLVVVASGMFSLAYVPSQVHVPGDPAATLARIISSEELFRAGIAGFMVMQVAFLLLPLALFRLFRHVNEPVAVLMVVLALASVPLGLASLAHRLDALALLTDPFFAQSLAPASLQAAATAALRAYSHGVLLTSLFWGLWLFPFGYLVLACGFLPRILGALLMLGGAGYMVNVFGEVLVPGFGDLAIASYAQLPAAAGELGTCAWLLLVAPEARR